MSINLKSELPKLLSLKRKAKIKDKVKHIMNAIEINKDMHSRYIYNELNQILESDSLNRKYYYINRLIKSLTQFKKSKYNDLNLNQWKKYDDIITDSLWIIDKRDKTGEHSAKYWGNFIPQIPNQLIRRFTKKNELVLDTFLGSGTTMIESIRLDRNCIGVELNPEVIKKTEEIIKKEIKSNESKSVTKIVKGDSKTVSLDKHLEKFKKKTVQLVIMHPPYWDIIKFSKYKKDLSNTETIDHFLDDFGKIIDNITHYLDSDRYLAVVIGDKYNKGEWIPIGFRVMNEVLNRNYKLKSVIVKNYEETSSKKGQENLWRYRALVGGFYIIKHEYILLFQKN